MFERFRITDLQSQKSKFSRQIREKDEEIEIVTSKLEQLRRDLRKSEKAKRSVSNIMSVFTVKY